jgi:ATP-binding cassette subfamily F protein 3
VDFMIARGQKIALVGKNGVGKSTLIRMVMRQEPHGGEFVPGHSVQVGYYAQNQSDTLDGNKTVFQTIDDEAVGDIRKSVRALLGAFLFSGDDVDKKVKVLSGGEKGRLALCKLLLQPYNFLILDEPTNHLDLASKEVLKQALQKYDGTMLVVSHDRDFLNGLTDVVYEIQPDRLRIWPGDVKEFLREKKAASIALFEQQKVKKTENTVVKNTQPVNADRETEKQKKRIEHQIRKCEEDIEKYEEKLAKIQVQMSEMDHSDLTKSQEASNQYQAIKTELDSAMMRWEELSNELSSL